MGDVRSVLTVNLKLARTNQAQGVIGYITRPGFIPKGSGFSAAAVALKDVRQDSTEAGISNNNCRGVDAQPDNGRNDWWAYGFSIFEGTGSDYTNCMWRAERPNPGNSNDKGQRQYQVKVYRGGSFIKVQQTYNGLLRTRTIINPGDNPCPPADNCLLIDPGAFAFGETNRYGREIGGNLSYLRYDSVSGGYRAPSGAERSGSNPNGRWDRIDRGVGYRSRLFGGNNPGFFCLDGPDAGGCSPPSP